MAVVMEVIDGELELSRKVPESKYGEKLLKMKNGLKEEIKDFDLELNVEEIMERMIVKVKILKAVQAKIMENFDGNVEPKLETGLLGKSEIAYVESGRFSVKIPEIYNSKSPFSKTGDKKEGENYEEKSENVHESIADSENAYVESGRFCLKIPVIYDSKNINIGDETAVERKSVEQKFEEVKLGNGNEKAKNTGNDENDVNGVKKFWDLRERKLFVADGDNKNAEKAGIGFFDESVCVESGRFSSKIPVICDNEEAVEKNGGEPSEERENAEIKPSLKFDKGKAGVEFGKENYVEINGKYNESENYLDLRERKIFYAENSNKMVGKMMNRRENSDDYREKLDRLNPPSKATVSYFAPLKKATKADDNTRSDYPTKLEELNVVGNASQNFICMSRSFATLTPPSGIQPLDILLKLYARTLIPQPFSQSCAPALATQQPLAPQPEQQHNLRESFCEQQLLEFQNAFQNTPSEQAHRKHFEVEEILKLSKSIYDAPNILMENRDNVIEADFYHFEIAQINDIFLEQISNELFNYLHYYRNSNPHLQHEYHQPPNILAETRLKTYILGEIRGVQAVILLDKFCPKSSVTTTFLRKMDALGEDNDKLILQQIVSPEIPLETVTSLHLKLIGETKEVDLSLIDTTAIDTSFEILLGRDSLKLWSNKKEFSKLFFKVDQPPIKKKEPTNSDNTQILIPYDAQLNECQPTLLTPAEIKSRFDAMRISDPPVRLPGT